MENPKHIGEIINELMPQFSEQITDDNDHQAIMEWLHAFFAEEPKTNEVIILKTKRHDKEICKPNNRRD